MSVRAHLATLRTVLEPLLDIVAEPVHEASAPEWCRRRGWDPFLLALSDPTLAICEARGLAAGLAGIGDVPADLRRLLDDLARVTRLPELSAATLEFPPEAWRGIPERKRAQIAAFLPVLAPLAARAERVVDVGAGKGHLARLAAESFGRDTIALDRDSERIRAGAERAGERARRLGELSLRFVVADACVTETELGARDLAVGLHACGELGDRLVLSAARAGCDLALISCCLQKLRADVRVPLSLAAAGLALPRAALGLTNLTASPDGVEAPLTENLRARETRVALRGLLRARGLTVAAGAEMRGVNRRRAHAGLADLAARALALRALPPPTAAEIETHESAAARDYARMRRLSLPRNLLASLVELSVVLDRAALLEERGYAVRVVRLFDRGVTPRNLALLASSDPERLPLLAQ